MKLVEVAFGKLNALWMRIEASIFGALFQAVELVLPRFHPHEFAAFFRHAQDGADII